MDRVGFDAALGDQLVAADFRRIRQLSFRRAFTGDALGIAARYGRIIGAICVIALLPASSWVRAALGAEATQAVTVKSFIQKLDPGDPNECSGTMAKLLAMIASCNFSENPQSPARGAKDFRLWSQVAVKASCDNGSLSSWELGTVRTGVGTEAIVLAAQGEVMEALTALPAGKGSRPTKQVWFSYMVRGRPSPVTEPSFQAVKARDCVYIWHRVEATLGCSGDQPTVDARITGSGFPSHRAWFGDKRVASVDQGPFTSLWVCDPHNKIMVK
jgi:hypothetical protein